MLEKRDAVGFLIIKLKSIFTVNLLDELTYHKAEDSSKKLSSSV
jgi:hypothetical protein